MAAEGKCGAPRHSAWPAEPHTHNITYETAMMLYTLMENFMEGTFVCTLYILRTPCLKNSR